MKKFSIILLLLSWALPSFANEDVEHPKQIKWKFDGVFGSVDRQSAQRGYQVYKEVCSACHSMHQISYRNLITNPKDKTPHGLGFSENEVKALAAEAQVTDGPNDQGDMFTRPGRPSDKFPAPFANEHAARAANNGAFPPDLSLIIKAREDGANYVHSLLTGFQEPPAGVHVGEGMHYNPYFPGRQIAMAPPLSAGQVTYMDGTEASVDQMARDVVNFLQWTAEPEMEERKRMGIRVLIFLLVFTGLFYVAKARIWSRLR